MGILDVESVNVKRRLLPPNIKPHVEDTMIKQKKELFEGLSRLNQEKDRNKMIGTFGLLSNYVKTNVYTLTNEEMATIIKTVYEFLTTSPYAIESIVACLDTYLKIFNYSVNSVDVTLDWKLAYNLIYNIMISYSKVNKQSSDLVNELAPHILILLLRFRYYYDPNEAENILNTFKESIENPSLPQNTNSIILLCFFMPVRRCNPELWFDYFMKLWSEWSSKQADLIFSLVYSCFASSGKKANWGPYIPYIFSRISSFINVPPLPSKNSNDAPEKADNFLSIEFMFFSDDDVIQENLNNAFALIILELLTSDYREELKKHMDILFHNIYDVYSRGLQDHPCHDFVDRLLEGFIMKLNGDLKKRSLTPPLTKDDRDWFVSHMIHLYGRELYDSGNLYDKITYLFQISPNIAVPNIFNVCEHLSEYPHFKYTAALGFSMIASVCFKENFEVKKLIENAKTFIEDINSSEPETSAIIFALYNQIGWNCDFQANFGIDFLVQLIRRSIEFAASCEGEDLKNCTSSLEIMLISIKHNMTPELEAEVDKLLAETYTTLPLSIIRTFIDTLSPKSLIPIVLNDKPTDKNMKVLCCLVRSIADFPTETANKTVDVILKTVEDENEKVKKIAFGCAKWILKHYVGTYPNDIRLYGPQKITDNIVTWHEPSEEEFDYAAKIGKKFFEKGKEIFNKATRPSIKLGGLLLIHATVRGISGAVDVYKLGKKITDEEIIEIKMNTSEKLTNLLIEITNWLLDNLTQDLHHSCQARIISTLIQCMAPKDDTVMNAKLFDSSFQLMKPFSNLRFLMPLYESYTPNAIYIWSIKMYKDWIQNVVIPFTDIRERILDKVTDFASSPYLSVFKAVTEFAVSIINYRTGVGKYYKKCIEAYDKSIQSGFNYEASSTAANCIVCFISVCHSSFGPISEGLLALCTPVPKDDCGTRIHAAQKHLLNTMSLVVQGQDVSYEEKLDFIRKLLAKAATYPADNDVDSFCMLILNQVATGIFDIDLFSYIINHIYSDDEDIKYSALDLFADTIELLIPRIDIPDAKGSDKISWDNYNDFKFKDNKSWKEKRHTSVLLKITDLMDHNVLSKYFNDHIQERAALAKYLNEVCNNDEFIKNTADSFSDTRNHDEIDIISEFILFWNTLGRLLGPEFVVKALNAARKMVSKLSREVVQFTGCEIVAGIVQSLARYSSDQIKSIYDQMLDVLTRTFELDGEFKWFSTLQTIMQRKDKRRFFWLKEMLLSIEPPANASITKKAKEKADLLSCLIMLCGYDKETLLSLMPRIEEIFDPKIISLPYSRSSIIEAILCYLVSLNMLGMREEIEQIFYEQIMAADDDFIYDFIMEAFGSYAGLTNFMFDLFALNIQDIVNGLDEKDDDQLHNLDNADFILFLSPPLFDYEEGKSLCEEVLDQLVPSPDVHWSTQCARISLAEFFISNTLFYTSPETIKKYLENNILNNSIYSNNQGVGMTSINLFNAVLIHCPSFECMRRGYVDDFKHKLFHPEPISRSKKPEKKGKKTMKRDDSDGMIIDTRVGPIRALTAIALSENILDKVSDVVLDALNAIVDASDINTNLKQIANGFFAAFWHRYNDNLTSEAAEKLTPFMFAIKPSYIA